MKVDKVIASLKKRAPIVKKYELSIEKGFSKKILRLFILRHKLIPYFYTKVLNSDFIKEGQMVYGSKLRLPLIDTNARFLYFFGTLSTEEYPLTLFLLKNLKDDDVFYDVGTSFGFYTFMGCELIKAGEIHSFEPNTFCFDTLIKNKNFNHIKNLRLNNFGLYSSDGERSFYGKDVSFYNGSAGYSLKSDVLEGGNHKEILKVKTKTLDSYIDSERVPTILKIDVEGSEYEVLVGAKKFLQSCSPTVIIEIWSNKKSSDYSKRAVDYMYTLGYSAHTINDEGDLQLADKSVDLFEFEAEFSNLVFKKV